MGWRWLLVGARAIAILLLLALVLPLQLILATVGRREFLPPRFLAVLGWLAGLRIRVEGRIEPGKLLLVGNHVSWLDIPALARACRAAFVAHGGLKGHRLLKWLCEQNDTVFVTRDRRGTVRDQVVQVREALAEQPLAIFLEGTTSDGRRLLPFKSSLLSAVEGAIADVTIQPVALLYRDAAEIAWHGTESGLANARQILARTRPIELTIRFLPPLSGASLVDRKAMAAGARAAIEDALKL
jgi:lyso-ornithine lipid O-acyltransferase